MYLKLLQAHKIHKDQRVWFLFIFFTILRQFQNCVEMPLCETFPMFKKVKLRKRWLSPERIQNHQAM